MNKLLAALLRDRGDPEKMVLQGAGWVFSVSPGGGGFPPSPQFPLYQRQIFCDFCMFSDGKVKYWGENFKK